MNKKTGAVSADELKETLQRFLDASTPEQLRAELVKGDRPAMQKLGYKPYLPSLDFSVPANVCIYQGEFVEPSICYVHFQCSISPFQSLDEDWCEVLDEAANQELALAG